MLLPNVMAAYVHWLPVVSGRFRFSAQTRGRKVTHAWVTFRVGSFQFFVGYFPPLVQQNSAA